jgi:hypothetical protein
VQVVQKMIVTKHEFRRLQSVRKRFRIKSRKRIRSIDARGYGLLEGGVTENGYN